MFWVLHVSLWCNCKVCESETVHTTRPPIIIYCSTTWPEVCIALLSNTQILTATWTLWSVTSSWLLSTFGLLAVLFRLLLRLMLTVASDLERWCVRLDGDKPWSPPRGPWPEAGDVTGQKGARVRGSLRARDPAGFSSSDRMSFLSLVPREWRWVEMCMSEE